MLSFRETVALTGGAHLSTIEMERSGDAQNALRSRN